MSRHMDCLRCHIPMNCLGTEKLQLGQTGLILGGLPNLFAGAMEVTIYRCRRCGKLEFFSPEGSGVEYSMETPRRTCPECSAEHDADCACCPICGHVYGK